MRIVRPSPTMTMPGRTRWRRRRARLSARSMTTGSGSTASPSRSSWRMTGKPPNSPRPACALNTTGRHLRPTSNPNMAKPAKWIGRTSRAATPPRRWLGPLCGTRRIMSCRPSTTTRWSSMRPRWSATAAAGLPSMTRRKVSRTSTNIYAVCSTRSTMISAWSRPMSAVPSAPDCGRNTRWCWRRLPRSNSSDPFVSC